MRLKTIGNKTLNLDHFLYAVKAPANGEYAAKCFAYFAGSDKPLVLSNAEYDVLRKMKK